MKTVAPKRSRPLTQSAYGKATKLTLLTRTLSATVRLESTPSNEVHSCERMPPLPSGCERDHAREKSQSTRFSSPCSLTGRRSSRAASYIPRSAKLSAGLSTRLYRESLIRLGRHPTRPVCGLEQDPLHPCHTRRPATTTPQTDKLGGLQCYRWNPTTQEACHRVISHDKALRAGGSGRNLVHAH